MQIDGLFSIPSQSLIEPVWNGNSCIATSGMQGHKSQSLIEPVWNGNVLPGFDTTGSYFYRHTAPLEQSPRTYQCARRNQYGTNDTQHYDVSSRQGRDMSIEIACAGARTPGACYVKMPLLDINALFSELYPPQNYQENRGTLENTTRGRQKLSKL